jgi:uncharacterized cupredoxin-like copper-binding protein
MNRRRQRTMIATAALCCVGLLGLLLALVARPASGGTAAAPVTVTVTAGKPSEFRFTLSKSSKLPVGVPITFKLTNKGKLAHDFKICTKAVKKATAVTCVGKVTKLVKPGQSTTLKVTFKTKGEYEYLCTVPGHAAGGMKGLIGVAVAATTTPPPKTTTSAAPPVKPPSTEALIGDPVDGATVFKTVASCGSCHTLAAAGATGVIGPDLDNIAAQLTQPLIVNQVTNGGQTMPAFGASLTATQINDVAAYVYQSTHQ